MRHALRLPEVAAANLLIGPPFHLSPSLFPCRTAASSHSPRPPCLAGNHRRRRRRRRRRRSAERSNATPVTRPASASQRFRHRRKAGARSSGPRHLHRWHLGDTHLHYRGPAGISRCRKTELLSLPVARVSPFPSGQLPRPNLSSSR